MAENKKLVGISSLSPIIKRIEELAKHKITSLSQLNNDKNFKSISYSRTTPNPVTDYWEQPY